MKNFRAYFGGYGNQYWTNLMEPNFYGTGNQITICDVNGESGEMKVIGQSEEIMSPGTLVVSPDQRFLYAANETNSFGGPGFGGGISAFAIEPDGNLTLINQSLAFGSCTAYITLDRTGKYILAASHGSYYYVSRFEKNADGTLYPAPQYDEGCVSLFAVREDGGVGELLDRVILEGTGFDQLMHGSSHPHSVLISENDDVIIPNKGGDNIYVARLDRDAGKLRVTSVCKTEKGSSPRHACFVPNTPYVLVQNEFDGCLCSYELKDGKLYRISRIDTCPPESNGPTSDIVSFAHPWGCDVQLHPNGRFVYTDSSNSSRVTLCELNRATGELTEKNHFSVNAVGMTRGMQIDRTGSFLAVTCVNQNKAVLYRIDTETGNLTPVSETELPTPTALRFTYPED